MTETPAQKATEALQAAQARHAKALEAVSELVELLSNAEVELDRAIAHLYHARRNPDLPVQGSPVSLGDTATASDSFGVSFGISSRTSRGR